MEEKEQVDYFGHVYDLGQQVPIEGNALLAIAKFLTEVIEKETSIFASFVFPKSVNQVKDDEGNLIRVECDWADHNKQSFMLTACDENAGQLGLTSTGVKASQILSALLTLHEKNINNNTAKKQEDINADRVFNT